METSTGRRTLTSKLIKYISCYDQMRYYLWCIYFCRHRSFNGQTNCLCHCDDEFIGCWQYWTRYRVNWASNRPHWRSWPTRPVACVPLDNRLQCTTSDRRSTANRDVLHRRKAVTSSTSTETWNAAKHFTTFRLLLQIIWLTAYYTRWLC